MKRLLLLTALLTGFTTTAQYQSQIKTLHIACNTSEDSIVVLFNPSEYTYELDEDLYIFKSKIDEGMYMIDYFEGITVASYVEEYSKEGLKGMYSSVKGFTSSSFRMDGSRFYESNEYIYLISDFEEEDNTALITITNRL